MAAASAQLPRRTPLPDAGALALWLVLLVVPVLVFAASGAVAGAAGAHWVYAFYDPDYPYLLNAVNLTEGVAPRHTDHPGTPVQELAAAILLIRHLVSGGGETIRQSVLTDPEASLSAISVCFRAMFSLALLAIGAGSRRVTGSVVCAVATQVLCSLSLVGLLSLWRVNPEPIVMSISVLLGVATLWALRSDRLMPAIAVSGLIAGLGLATKITSLPICVAPLWACRRLRPASIYAGGVLAAVLLATLPIWSQAGRVFGWFTALTVYDGHYGLPRRHTFIDPSRYLFDLRRMIVAEPVAAIAAGASVALVAHAVLSRRWRVMDPLARRAGAALVCVSVAELLQYLMVAKHPGARYLLPGLALAGLNLPLAYLVVRGAYSGPMRRGLAVAGLAAVLAGAAWTAVRLERALDALGRTSAACIALRQAAADIASSEHALLITRYGSSSPVYALINGDGWAGRRFTADLARMFPDEITVDEFTGRYVRQGQAVSAEQMGAWTAEGRLLFQSISSMLPTEFDGEPMRVTPSEGLYRLHPRVPAPQERPESSR